MAFRAWESGLFEFNSELTWIDTSREIVVFTTVIPHLRMAGGCPPDGGSPTRGGFQSFFFIFLSASETRCNASSNKIMFPETGFYVS